MITPTLTLPSMTLLLALFSAPAPEPTQAPARAADAVDLEALPLGAWFDLEDCFAGRGREACARAAGHLDEPAWTAHFAGEPLPGEAPAASMRLDRHLRCARAWPHEEETAPDRDGAAACRELGATARGDGRRVAAAVWLATACLAGDDAACGAFTRRPAATDGGGVDGALAARAGREEVAAADLGPLASACDGDDLDACLDLVGAHHRLRAALATDDAAAAALGRACAEGSAAACELRAHRDAPDAPVDAAAAGAVALLDAVCESGRAGGACALASRLLDSGRGMPWGHLGGLARADMACATGERPGCERLLAALGSGGYGEALLGRCAALAGGGETGEARHDARACALAATMRASGRGLGQDAEAYRALSRLGCAAGEARACHALVEEARAAGDAEGRQRALEEACVAGDGAACGEAGRARAYAVDEGEADPEGARRLLSRGCRFGSAFACYELGFLHSRGVGVARDAARAARLYGVACGRGSAPGCAGLGILYVDGRGVARDGERAVWLLGLACARGYGPGCRTLGDVHANGYAGVGRLPAAARAAYRRACELGDRQGCERQAELGPGPEAPPAAGRPPEEVATLAEALTGERTDGEIPARPARRGPSEATLFALAWTGVEIGVSHRDTSALDEATRERTSDVRLTYPGFDLGALVGQRGGGYGFRLQLGVSFDLGNAFDEARSNSPRLGGLHLEANLEAFVSVGGDVLVALAAGWHGLSGPLTKNSSLAVSLLVIAPARRPDAVGWFARVTPAQLFAANERWLLSPLAVEARAVFGGAFSAGVEVQWVGAPSADTQDLVAEGWALLFRFGSGLATSW